MFKRSDKRLQAPHAGQGRALARGAALLPLLMLPIVAAAVVTTTEPPSGPAEAAIPAKPGGTYQIRCWQNGRLLFEENRISLPDTAQYGLRIGGHDREGRPVYVADTKNATCLIRHAAEARSRP